MSEYVTRRGCTVVLQIEDIGSRTSVRPGREELLRAARRRQIDLVLFWRLNRWVRPLLDLINSLQELTAQGVGFASITGKRRSRIDRHHQIEAQRRSCGRSTTCSTR